MRLIYAALPRNVRAVLVDADTLVVSDDMRMFALPTLPVFLATVMAATLGGQPVETLLRLVG